MGNHPRRGTGVKKAGFGSPVSTANEYACKGLDKLEEKLPILQQPTEMVTFCPPPNSGGTGIEPWACCWDKPPPFNFPPPQVVAGTRELVSSTVSGAVGLARGAMQGSVERTRRALSTGISTVAGSRVGQLLATGADTVLEKSEELVEHYLPRTDEEPGECWARRAQKPSRPLFGVPFLQDCAPSPGLSSTQCLSPPPLAPRGGAEPYGDTRAQGTVPVWLLCGHPELGNAAQRWVNSHLESRKQI